MITLFSPVNSFLNKKRSTITDTKVFRLHTILTPTIFLAFGVLYSFKEFIGEPIYCLGPGGGGDDKTIFANNYCWVSATYSIQEYFRADVSKYLPYPGVGQLLPGSGVIFHKYYMWIPFFFLFLAVLFYTPRYVWKSMEGNHIKMLRDKLDTATIMQGDNDDKKDRIHLLTRYIFKSLGFNNCYALVFFGCEIANFCIVLGSFWATDVLINYKFATYGADVVRFWRGRGSNGGRINPMTEVFPKLTKCLVNFYGVSGNIQPLDYICTMSINNFNDKIFFFLWFYFIVLISISGLAILFRAAIIFCPKLRVLMLKQSLIKISKKNASNNSSDTKFAKLMIGDWFVIHQLSKNIDKLAYFDFLDELGRKLEPDDKGDEEGDLKV